MAFDTLIKNGTVVDGSGGARYRADVAISDGKIAFVGDAGDSRVVADETFDVSGLWVAPGFIETAMTAELPEESRETAAREIPLGRFGSAEEIAGAVAFLAGPHASYVTGTVLRVDGGLLL